MPYAAQADIVTLYGPDALVVADRDGDGVADEAAVARALEEAGHEIDSYLAVRHAVPLAEAPPVVRRWCVDIAVYYLAQTADVLTDELRRRYEDVIAAMRRVAKGEQKLVLAAAPEGEGGGDADAGSLSDGPSPVATEGPPRLFSRDAMRGF